jgi:hypothetical protein
VSVTSVRSCSTAVAACVGGADHFARRRDVARLAHDPHPPRGNPEELKIPARDALRDLAQGLRESCPLSIWCLAGRTLILDLDLRVGVRQAGLAPWFWGPAR